MRAIRELRTMLMIGLLVLMPEAGNCITIFYPEPFDFHYPDEKVHENISGKIKMIATLGEYESGTFVVYSDEDVEHVVLRTGELLGPEGYVISKKNIEIGIVTFMSREGNMAYLRNTWVGGMPAAKGLNAPYSGFNKDAKDRLPILPVCIVKDDIEFEAQKNDATNHIVLSDRNNVRTYLKEGESKQFWITIHVPDEIDLNKIKTLFKGRLELYLNDRLVWIPIELEVINYRLDKLVKHGKYMGVMRAWDVGEEFRDAAMRDIRAHGCNAIRAPLNCLKDYEYVKQYGFDLAITTRNTWNQSEVKKIRGIGFLPLMYGRDEPGKPPPWKAKKTILRHIELTRRIKEVGGLAGTSGGYNVLKEIVENRGIKQDWWLMGTSTRGWYSKYWMDLSKAFKYIADVRKNPSNKIVNLQGSYEGTMNGHYPLLTRILYGFWLYNSNFDMGIHWGYAYRSREINPYKNTKSFMVAFPAIIKDEKGNILRKEMIPSYTWEAFREGIDDLKYTLTVRRLIKSKLDNAEKRAEFKSEFENILAPFAEIDVNYEHKIRIDAYNGYAGTRVARKKLADMMTQILSE